MNWKCGIDAAKVTLRQADTPSVSTPAASTCLLLPLSSRMLKHGNQSAETESTSPMSCDRHTKGGERTRQITRLDESAIGGGNATSEWYL